MPFGRIDFPSLALAQIKSVLKHQFKDEIVINEIYINHDFALYFGLEYYKILSGNSVYIKFDGDKIDKPSLRKRSGGLFKDREFSSAGDWIFKHLAFPEVPDNHKSYFDAYFYNSSEISGNLLKLRDGLEDYLIELIYKHKLHKYDMICMTSMFQQQTANIALANKIKHINPNVYTVLGGCNIDTAFPWVQHVKSIDFTLRGAGLIGIVRLVQSVLQKKQQSMQLIKGLGYKEKIIHGQLYGEKMPISPPIQLDYNVFLSSLDNHFGQNTIKPILFWETSRGCWWADKVKCTFCDCFDHLTKFEVMNSEDAINYINETIDKYKDRCTYFWAVDAALPKDYCESVLPYVNSRKDVNIFYEVRADLNEFQIKSLVKANVVMVQAGIEALHTDLLRKMRKGTTVFSNIKFLKNCCMYGISVLWNLLAGIEGENLNHYNVVFQQIDRITHLFPPTGMWPISYDKYSDYVQNNAFYDLKLIPDTRVLKYIYPYDEKELNQMAYFYMNAHPEKTYSSAIIKMIERINKKINHWVALWKEDRIPMLYKYDDKRIFDSRGNVVEFHELSDTEMRMIDFLDSVKSKEQLSQHFGKQETHMLLQRLNEFKLVWSEGDKYISLLHNKKPKLPVPYIHLKGWQFE